MTDQQFEQNDDIDFKKYIGILIKWRRFILSLFLIGVLMAAVFTFCAPKIYKATTTIMILSFPSQSVISSSKGLLDLALPVSIDTHIALIKSNPVLEMTLQKLNLKDPSGRPVILEDLGNRLNITKLIAGENLVQLEATDTNPQVAKAIANAWAEQYVVYSKEVIRGEITAIANFLVSQFEISRKNLRQAEEKVNTFKKEYKQDLLSAELSIKKQLLNNYKSELVGIELMLKTKADSLAELKKQIATQERFIIVSKAITDDALWQLSLKEKNRLEMDKSNLKSEIINPVYQGLEKRIVDTEIEVNILKPKKEYLSLSIESMRKEIKQMDNDIIEKDFELAQLTQETELCQKSYNSISEKIDAASMVKLAQFLDVKIISPANTPRSPVVQGKKKGIIVAGLKSLLLGVVLAFCLEFWQKGKLQG